MPLQFAVWPRFNDGSIIPRNSFRWVSALFGYDNAEIIASEMYGGNPKDWTVYHYGTEGQYLDADGVPHDRDGMPFPFREAKEEERWTIR